MYHETSDSDGSGCGEYYLLACDAAWVVERYYFRGSCCLQGIYQTTQHHFPDDYTF